MEKVYKLNQENPMGGREPGKEEDSAAHTQLSSEYYGRISAVSEAGGCGPAEGYGITDIRGFSPVRRRISGVFGKLGELYSSVMNNQPDGKRKPRKLTLISSPVTEEKKK